MGDPASAKEKQQAEYDETDDEREEGIAVWHLGRRTSDAGNERHVRPKAGGWRSVGHRQDDCTVKLAGVANRRMEKARVGGGERGRGGCVSEMETRACGRLVSVQIAS